MTPYQELSTRMAIAKANGVPYHSVRLTDIAYEGVSVKGRKYWVDYTTPQCTGTARATVPYVKGVPDNYNPVRVE